MVLVFYVLAYLYRFEYISMIIKMIGETCFTKVEGLDDLGIIWLFKTLLLVLGRQSIAKTSLYLLLCYTYRLCPTRGSGTCAANSSLPASRFVNGQLLVLLLNEQFEKTHFEILPSRSRRYPTTLACPSSDSLVSANMPKVPIKWNPCSVI